MTAPITPKTKDLPLPLVHFARHPVRWLRNEVERVVDAVVLAHIGMFIVVALYYLLFEINPSMTHWWHTVVSNSDLRHSIRDVAEGVLGGFLAQAIVWNHFSKHHLKAGRFFDWLHARWHLPEVPAALLVTLLFAVAGFEIAYWSLHAFHVHAAGAQGNSYWSRSAGIWNSDWDKKVMGYAAAFVARRPMHVVFDDVQLWFADRRLDLGKRVHWWHPPTFRARYNSIAADPLHTVESHGGWQAVLMVGALIVGLGLAGYGDYILTYIA